MEQKIHFTDEFASENHYCMSLSDTAELIEEADENFNTDNDGSLLVEVEYPEFTVDEISKFLDENNREYTLEEKSMAIKLVTWYEDDNTVEVDYIVRLLDRVLRKKARSELIKEAAKLGISVQSIRFSSYPLEDMRKSRHLTQAQLAELSGVSQQNISEYESGKRNLLTARADTLMKLAVVLGCFIDDIL